MCVTIGAIPADIGKLTSLAELWIEKNKLTGWYSYANFILS